MVFAFVVSVTAAHGRELRVRTTHSKVGVSGFVRGGNTGYFGVDAVNIKNAGVVDDFARKGYIRMDVSAVDFTVRSAYLDMVVCLTDVIYKDVAQTIKVYGLTDESLDNWDPAKTTWNNAPANDISSASGVETNKAVFLGDFSVAYEDTGSSRRFSSSALVDFLNADSNGKVTFILCRPESVETYSGWNLLLAGDDHELYAPPQLTLSSDITTLSGSNGISGRVSADGVSLFGVPGGWHLKNDAGKLTRFTRKGYIRFDLSQLDTDKVTGSSLNLSLYIIDNIHHYYGQEQTLSVYGLTDESLDSWNPAEMTWDNAPGNDTNSATEVNSAITAALGEIKIEPRSSVGAIKSLSGKALDDFLNADTNDKVTFIISRKNTKGYKRDLKIAGEYDAGYPPPFLSFASVFE